MAWLLNFLARRLFQGLIVVLLVTFGIFAVLRMVPGNPARFVLGPMASEKVVAEATKAMGLDHPIPLQYVHWLGQISQGNFGRSYIRAYNGSQVGGSHEAIGFADKAKVWALMGKALPYTLQLAALALVFTALVAIPLGLAAGLWAERWPDKLALFLGSSFVSIPNFWLAVVLALIVTAKLHLIPSIGYKGFSYTILPAIVVAVEMIPIAMRAISTSVVVAKQEGFIALARIRGLSAGRILFGHTLRNSAVPILNLFGVQIGALLGSLFIVEYVFNYPGIGQLAVQAVLQRDFPVIQGIAVLIAVFFIVINILVDLISNRIDPRLNL